MSAPSISYHLSISSGRPALSPHAKKGQFVTYSLETTVLYESLGWILNLTNKRAIPCKQTQDPQKLNWLEFITPRTPPFPFLALEWDKFPARIPIHWNIQGTLTVGHQSPSAC